MKNVLEKPHIDFIGIGVNKCGSTWVYRCLKEHPCICVSREKETHFFNRNYYQGYTWYQKQFTHCNKKEIRGEFSPEYMDDPATIKRIYTDYPNVKILIIIREPIDRLRSSWEFDYRRGRHNQIRFESYIPNMEQRLKDKGLYYTRIKNVLQYFPREQIHLMFFDDIKKRPTQSIHDLYAFLGVDTNFSPPTLSKKINSSRDTDVKVRWVNNMIFFCRKLKVYLFGNSLNPALNFFKIGVLATQIHRLNRTKKISFATLDKTLSESSYVALRELYEPELVGLRDNLNLPVPDSWFTSLKITNDDVD